MVTKTLQAPEASSAPSPKGEHEMPVAMPTFRYKSSKFAHTVLLFCNLLASTGQRSFIIPDGHHSVIDAIRENLDFRI
jgi:hypothetical protein